MNWDELESICRQCQQCKLSATRTNVVFGVGNRQSSILFVGEGPGYHEDLQGEPFVGDAGKLLDKILASVHFSRQDVYIANIVKCRPPNNRDPEPDEIECCMSFLRHQFLLLRPKILVCLGRVAAKAIIHPDFAITRQRGQWFERKGCFIMATFHPSALLRDESKKAFVWEDMKAIRKKYDELV